MGRQSLSVRRRPTNRNSWSSGTIIALFPRTRRWDVLSENGLPNRWLYTLFGIR
jgi:hypothetical protein